ncbi:hypothetical protein B0H13DRAFT_651179 [Mycena leptocephala]|nr:hypothetical protein B0H13DRAFT_651179 [Mycena leptocephala]
MNAGSKFRMAEARLWAKEDHASWEAVVDDEDVNWKERQRLVAGGFKHMVETIHGTGKFRPLVATVVTAWLDEHGQLQLDWVEAVPEGIRVRQPFEKQYAKLTSDYINAMYAWAEKPLQDFVAARDNSARPAPPVFPVSAEALDDMSPNMVAQTVTGFLVKSYHAVFGSEDIPWTAIASTPDEYYDTVKFDIAFGSKGLEELKSTQWHALATTLASGAGEGTSGSSARHLQWPARRRSMGWHGGGGGGGGGASQAGGGGGARLKQEEEARSKREAEEARLKREEEARLKREEEEARLKREEEARLKREKEEQAGRSQEGDTPKPLGRKRKPEEQLVPEDASAVRRTGRTRLTPEEAKAEREKKLAVTVGVGKVKPSYEYVTVLRSPAKPKRAYTKRT